MSRATMNSAAVRSARHDLGLTQRQLAPLLGYAHEMRVSDIERGVKPISAAGQLLLEAYLSGYRPEDWPEKEEDHK